MGWKEKLETIPEADITDKPAWINFFTELEKHGFKIEITCKIMTSMFPNTPTFYTAVKIKAATHGISIRTNGLNTTVVNVYIATVAGGYFYCSRLLITEDLNMRCVYYKSIVPDKIERKKPVTLATLPEPLKFHRLAITERNGSFHLNAIMERAKVVGMVTIEQNGKISDKHIANPNENIWFHLDCSGLQGATFDIISNGEIFHPIVRYGTKRVTTETNPKASVELENASELDRQLIKRAIEKFMEGIT
jgi:hypothetical protein